MLLYVMNERTSITQRPKDVKSQQREKWNKFRVLKEKKDNVAACGSKTGHFTA